MKIAFAILSGVLSYIPPTSYVFDQWTDRSKEVKSIHVKMETSIFEGTSAIPVATVEDEIWIRRPNYMRRTIKSDKGKIDYVLTPARAVQISGDRVDPLPPLNVLGAIGLFYLPDGPKRMSAMLKQVTVSVDMTKLDMQDNRVLYQVGAAGGNFLWFSKDEWLPAGGEILGRQFRLSTNLPSRFPIPFPDLIEVYQNQKKIEQSRTLSVNTKENLPDSLFDINVLRNPAPKQ